MFIVDRNGVKHMKPSAPPLRGRNPRKVGFSAVLQAKRFLTFCLIRNLKADASARAGLAGDGQAPAVQPDQTRIDVVQADAYAAAWQNRELFDDLCGHSDPVVFNGKLQLIFNPSDRYGHAPAASFFAQAVADGVFHQRLKREGRYLNGRQRFRQLKDDLDVRKARSFDGGIRAYKLQLLFQRDDAAEIVIIQGLTQIFGQRENEPARLIGSVSQLSAMTVRAL